MKGLTQQQLIMLSLIIRQRQKTGRDFIEFNYEDAQGCLDESGDAYAYGIVDRRGQEAILQQLKDKVPLKVNYVVERYSNETGTYRLAWADDDFAWIGDAFVGLVPPYQTLEDVYHKVFILVTPDDIRKIYDDCDDVQKRVLFSNEDSAMHTAYLIYKDAHFVVRCDEQEYILRTSHNGNTSRILEHVAKGGNIGKAFSRDELRKELSIRGLGPLTGVFKNNTQVKKILAPFILLDYDTIQVKSKALITTSQLEMIRASQQ